MIGNAIGMITLAALSCLMTYLMVTEGLGLEIKNWAWIIWPFIVQVICSMLVQGIQSEYI